MKYQNERRSSIESMYEYDMPNSRESGYHKTYLKMVGATIALTFIGIIVFIEVEKSGTLAKPQLDKFTEQTLISSKNSQPVYQSGEARRRRPIKNTTQNADEANLFKYATRIPAAMDENRKLHTIKKSRVEATSETDSQLNF